MEQKLCSITGMPLYHNEETYSAAQIQNIVESGARSLERHFGFTAAVEYRHTCRRHINLAACIDAGVTLADGTTSADLRDQVNKIWEEDFLTWKSKQTQAA